MDWQANKDIVGGFLNEGIYSSEKMLAFGKKAWPEFAQHDLTAREYWEAYASSFPDFVFGLYDKAKKEIIARSICIPVRWDGDLSDLPEEGWGWALKNGVENKGKLDPNYLCAIEISIAQEYKGQRLSYFLLEEMAKKAREIGVATLLAPVRPSMKTQFPLIPIDQYIKWPGPGGLPFDPWLRVHSRFGGELIKPCLRSMNFDHPVQDWEEWTEQKFPGVGRYCVEGALEPLEVYDKNGALYGRYTEPNVWIAHQIN